MTTAISNGKPRKPHFEAARSAPVFDAVSAVAAAATFLSYVDPSNNAPPPAGATDAAYDFLDAAPVNDPLRALAEIVIDASELCDPFFGVAIDHNAKTADPRERIDHWAGVHWRLCRFLYDNPTISPPADLTQWVDAVPIEEALSVLGSCDSRRDATGHTAAVKRLRSLGVSVAELPGEISVKVEPADWGKSIVRFDVEHGKSFTDKIDALSDFQRTKSVVTALERLGATGDLEPVVTRLAGEIEAVAAATGSAQPTEGDERKIDYHLWNCADLVSTAFDIRFLVEGIVAANQPLVIAGPQKALKTSIALDMAFAMATAGRFLRRFKVPEPVAVGFFSGESGLPTLAETLRRIARAAGHDPSGIRNLIISDRVPQIGSPDHLHAIDAVIQEYALEAIFIDPVFMAMDGADAGNLFIQGQLLRRVSEVCQERGCTLILLHHVKKGSGNDFQPVELSAIAWSGFAEAARQWVLLSRRELYEPESGLYQLHLSVGGSAGHGGLWGLDVAEGTYQAGVDRLWNVTVLAAEEVQTNSRDQRQEQRKAKAESDLDADRREICQVAVKLLNGGESKTGIRERCQCGHARFGRAFASLVEDGTLQPTTTTKPNGQTYSAWKLRNDQDA